MVFDRINIMLPTRGRSNGLLGKHIASTIDFVSDPRHICFTFLVDMDDKDSRDLLTGIRVPFETQIILRHSGLPHLAEMYNKIYAETIFKEPTTLVTMVGDDMQWRTPAFDVAILDEMNRHNGIGLVYVDDGYFHSKKRSVNHFMSRAFVEATEMPYMCEAFPADYIDDGWFRIAEGVNGVHFLEEVQLYHDHASRYPRDMQDETTARLRARVGESRRNLDQLDAWVTAAVANLRKNGMVCPG